MLAIRRHNALALMRLMSHFLIKGAINEKPECPDNASATQAITALSLTTAEMTELTRSLDAITVRGQRLPEAVQVYSDVEAPIKS